MVCDTETKPTDADRGEQRAHTVFVHDFSPIDSPFQLATTALVSKVSTELVARRVVAAYHRETPASTLDIADVIVQFGPTRSRVDAIIVPLSLDFPSGGGLSLEADLELAAYQADRCHLHLLGRVALTPEVEPGSQAASLAGRLAVAVVRHVLNDLADILGEPPLAFRDLSS
jgi:hypothetical protein